MNDNTHAREVSGIDVAAYRRLAESRGLALADVIEHARADNLAAVVRLPVVGAGRTNAQRRRTTTPAEAYATLRARQPDGTVTGRQAQAMIQARIENEHRQRHLELRRRGPV